MLGWMLAAGLAVQAQAITAQNVDAFLAEQVAGLQADVGRNDNGLTLESATLQGRTIRMQWRLANELTPGYMDMIEEMRLASCDEADAQSLLGLGAVERNVYVDPHGLRFQFDFSARTCDGDRFHTSSGWRSVSIRPRAALAVDATSVAADGPRRRFLLVLLSARPSDPDEVFRKEVNVVDCEAQTFTRQSVVIYDDMSRAVAEDAEPMETKPVNPRSPMAKALQSVCTGTWTDPTDRDLKGFFELAKKTLERPGEE